MVGGKNIEFIIKGLTNVVKNSRCVLEIPRIEKKSKNLSHCAKIFFQLHPKTYPKCTKNLTNVPKNSSQRNKKLSKNWLDQLWCSRLTYFVAIAILPLMFELKLFHCSFLY